MKGIPPVVISGSIAIDRIMNFSGRYRDHIRLEKLDSLSISIFLDELKDAYGGNGANIAYSMALLGDEPVLLGSVGKDALLYMEKLAHEGVNIKYIFESELPTAAFNVITDADQNQVGGFYPGAMFDSDSLSFEPWKNDKPLVVVAPHDPKAMKRQVEESKKWGLRLVYDIGQQVSNLPGDEMTVGVKAAEILILNDYELTVLSKKTGLSIDEIKTIVPIVVTTLGKKGSVIEGKKVPKAITVGVVKPVRVADPTGAGDAYRAGFLYGYVRGWPLKACAQLSAVLGTYAIETMGTQSHTFTFGEVKKRYGDSFGESLPDA
ncbi:MAG TPA: carbohydrate kinase family protein [Candidatus Saccharimonadales bacterium]|nr:carbohydrate kinase family protein [Candidatus Saccharimonadales bacterium]